MEKTEINQEEKEINSDKKEKNNKDKCKFCNKNGHKQNDCKILKEKILDKVNNIELNKNKFNNNDKENHNNKLNHKKKKKESFLDIDDIKEIEIDNSETKNNYISRTSRFSRNKLDPDYYKKKYFKLLESNYNELKKYEKNIKHKKYKFNKDYSSYFTRYNKNKYNQMSKILFTLPFKHCNRCKGKGKHKEYCNYNSDFSDTSSNNSNSQDYDKYNFKNNDSNNQSQSSDSSNIEYKHRYDRNYIVQPKRHLTKDGKKFKHFTFR